MNRSRSVAVVGSALAVVVLLTAAIVAVVRHHDHRLRLTAYFTESNGIYAGNHVDILGLPIGSVQSVTPEPGQVKVVLSLPANTKIPANAQAFIVPPSVISDRYVGLSPAYRSGPVMANGHVIPLADTHVPAEFDDLVGSLTTLFNALGPKEANAKGAVGHLINVLSANLAGNGSKIHDTIVGLSSATDALTADRGGIATVVRKLDNLTKNLAARDALIGSFNADLAAASSELARQRGTITAVLDNLSRGLLQVASFVRSHRGELHGTLTDLVTTTNLLLKHQRALIETLDELPLATQNLSRINHGGQIALKFGEPGQNSVVNNLLTKECKSLPLLCTVFGTPPHAAQQSSSGLAALFGAGR